MKKINKPLLYIIITLFISWVTAGIYYLINGGRGSQLGFTIMAASYMFIPFICVIIIKLLFKERLFSDLYISFKINRWFFVSWLIFPVLTFCTFGVNILFPGITYNPEMTGFLSRFNGTIPPEVLEEFKNQVDAVPNIVFILLLLLQGLVAGITINAIAAFGEEVGWRGFLLKEFKTMNFLNAALVIGFIWGIWHAPLILMGHNYPQHPRIGVLMMTIFCILLTPIFQYITIKSKSVIAAAIAHGTLNAVAGLSIMAFSGGNDLTTGAAGLPGFITILIFNAGIFVYDYYISKEKIYLNRIDKYIE